MHLFLLKALQTKGQFKATTIIKLFMKKTERMKIYQTKESDRKIDRKRDKQNE